MPRTATWIIFTAFSALSAWAVWQLGLLGFYLRVFRNAVNEPAGAQVFTDLLVMALITLGFIYHDAKAKGRRFWPWAVFTITCGSFGPLLYLLTSPTSKE